MRKEGVEYLILTVYIEGERNKKGKQRIILLTSLCIWLEEQGLGERGKKIAESYKEQGLVESHESARTEEKRHIEEVVVFVIKVQYQIERK